MVIEELHTPTYDRKTQLSDQGRNERKTLQSPQSINLTNSTASESEQSEMFQSLTFKSDRAIAENVTYSVKDDY